jgi:putative transposase
MAPKIFNPFLLLLARLTSRELVETVQFLKEENKILRSKLPRIVPVTKQERNRLLKLGESLGSALKEIISIVSHRTFLRWKAEKKGKTKKKAPNRNPRRTPEEVRNLVIRLANENDWGYTRILSELRKLGEHKISRTTVRNILAAEGLDPGPKRGKGTWHEFIKIHWDTLIACDFFTKDVYTIFGKVTCYVLFFIEIKTRRVWIAGVTPNPDSAWMAQAARNFTMWCEDEVISPSYLIRDGDTKFTKQFDAIVEDTGATVKELPYRAPEMNSYAESWVGTIKRECLNNFLPLSVRHLEYIVNVFISYYNSRRAHRGLGNVPIGIGEPPKPEKVTRKKGVVCHSWLGGVLRHYERAA